MSRLGRVEGAQWGLAGGFKVRLEPVEVIDGKGFVERWRGGEGRADRRRLAFICHGHQT